MQIGLLRARMDDTVREVTVRLPSSHVGTLYRGSERWQSADGWRLINVADPRGT